MNRVLIYFITASFLIFVHTDMHSFGKKEKKDTEPAVRIEAPSGQEEVSARETVSSLYESAAAGQVVEITGRIRLVGNEPFPQLVLTDMDSNDWFISDESRKLLAGYEQQTVSVRGRVELLEMKLANGSVVGTRRILADITVLP
ncbi:hypothetical protein K7I13_04520 [Brucepastera parasyntrophica]|uniref:hypothetical protein n=1 Tax=Brucepastera parasyntrophica TaxID=2880008 RepID=UPI00210B4082|nr:hypothetical protein [Brucepastera parasyntrophica]ULQ60559.1 hypothetical protein K7I13_04520 [Brucepastera parasyntrophica]